MNRTTEMTNYNHPQDDRVPERLPLTPAEQIERDRLDRAVANRDEQIQFERELAAENSGAASGIAIGVTIAGLIGLGAGAIYYFGRPQPAPTTIITTPASPATSTAPKPEQPTTIERTTIDRTAPAPAPQVIAVPKPILVPGATRTIELPTPTVTTEENTPSRGSQPAVSPAPVPFSAPSSFTAPAPGASPSSDSSGSGSPGTSPSPDPSGSVSPATPGSGSN
jgi:hypothetical protein